MITDKDERWTFGHALHVENPTIGNFIRNTLYCKISIPPTKSNWVLASIPTPNVTEGWKISSVILRFTIKGSPGIIDKIGIRDGDKIVHAFEGLSIGWPTTITGWETLRLPLSQSKVFKFGLGISIHVNYPFAPDQPRAPAEFLFASVGLGFVKEPSIEPPIGGARARAKKAH